MNCADGTSVTNAAPETPSISLCGQLLKCNGAAKPSICRAVPGLDYSLFSHQSVNASTTTLDYFPWMLRWREDCSESERWRKQIHTDKPDEICWWKKKKNHITHGRHCQKTQGDSHIGPKARSSARRPAWSGSNPVKDEPTALLFETN
ncbi:hypothetical protein EYF80_051761 [Liparis tanakae]|uniref:Uncharacterized protein n=1 Tax=Liparis tanakae TaxID=230148 RepID=A0A4Z2FBC9_9TELE|nr:hypothetical protein EYF80_051761 [Liparis tanakae]